MPSPKTYLHSWERLASNEDRERRMVFLAWRDLFEDDEMWCGFSLFHLQQKVDLHYDTHAALCGFMPKVRLKATLAWLLKMGWMKKGSPARKFLKKVSVSPVASPRNTGDRQHDSIGPVSSIQTSGKKPRKRQRKGNENSAGDVSYESGNGQANTRNEIAQPNPMEGNISQWATNKKLPGTHGELLLSPSLPV